MGKVVKALKKVGVAVNGEEPSGRYITQVLKSFGLEYTEQPIVGKGVADILEDIANKKGLKIVAVTDNTIDLLGKVASDLQSNITFTEKGISGMLKYVSNYTGFSSNVSEQKGNYIALKATSKQGATIKALIVGGDHGEVTLDSDGILVARIKNDKQSIRFTATKDNEKYVVEYPLTNLVLLNS
jgi:hypothetical protein